MVIIICIVKGVLIESVDTMQVRPLQADLKKGARHPILELRPLGRHNECSDISALGSHGETDMFDITICHPLSPLCQVYCLAFEEELTVPLKYLSLFITP